MKTDKMNKKLNPAFGIESRKKKDLIINVMVASIVAFIAVVLISEMAIK
ncbi:hypothetical protein K6T82_11460 [Flavobacterium sp. 17A]|uniref:Uncharacterized protein n=1 Tax=Flavobacterium potami TaxID=2872310 RepID=A0A9X1HAV3_9FLAO|nr:hypothetical protein [Flavobacterium potami]MBZ4035386.1 hypothetical protein [Flavobacterium potami]